MVRRLRTMAVALGQAALVVFTVLDMAWPHPQTVWLIALSAGLFMACAESTASIGIRRTVRVLVLVTLSLLPLAPAPGAALEQGIRIGGLISSILLSVSLLSRAAQRVALLRQVLAALLNVHPRRRGVSIAVASQLFGGFLGFAGINMLMEAAAKLPSEGLDEKRDCFRSISRGYAAANLWSPMYSNVSILLALSPGLAWGKVFPLALLLAVASLAVGIALDRFRARHALAGEGRASGLGAVLWAAWPVLAGMLVFLGGALGFSWIGHLPVAALIIVMAPLGALLLTLYMEPSRRSLPEAIHQLAVDFRGFHLLAAEVRLLMASGCAGTVVAAVIPVSWTAPIAAALAPFPILGCLFLPFSVVLLSCTSAPPMLSGIVVASAFPATAMALSPSAHLLTVLAGLGMAVATTPFSVVSLMASRFSGLPVLTVSVRANLGYAFLSLLIVGFILGGTAGHFIR